MNPVEVIPGTTVLVLAQPHGGTWLPPELLPRLHERGRAVADTDWHIAELYEGLAPDATIVRAKFSRYLIDANRDPQDVPLYPGRNGTGLCPTVDFEGQAIYAEGQEPSAEEIAQRRARFHAPYHAALQHAIEQVRARHGVALVYDCHSIRSELPFLFEGVLPILNAGTYDGRACGRAIREVLAAACREAAAHGYDAVLDGRFRGGYTTRFYGQPEQGVHAVQMELAQRAYMIETPPWTLQTSLANRLRAELQRILFALVEAVTTASPTHPLR